uniref:ATP-dependent DNA helicase n=1 Tax=Ditylenchus dipsaci TaxID=166011 RepID=A0A915ELW0_9BILA
MPPHRLELRVGAIVMLLRNVNVQLGCAMAPSPRGADERHFFRTQFPIRLAFAMTINKAQGQTADRVGLALHTEVFGAAKLIRGSWSIDGSLRTSSTASTALHANFYRSAAHSVHHDCSVRSRLSAALLCASMMAMSTSISGPFLHKLELNSNTSPLLFPSGTCTAFRASIHIRHLHISSAQFRN